MDLHLTDGAELVGLQILDNAGFANCERRRFYFKKADSINKKLAIIQE